MVPKRIVRARMQWIDTYQDNSSLIVPQELFMNLIGP